jgi:hypothetical protein
MKLKIVLLVPAMALGGCAASTYCEGEQDYQTARSVPAPQSAAALQIPQSESALRIPPQPENSVPYGEEYVDEDGDESVRCLDKPPEMPAPKPLPEEKPVPEAPVQEVPAEQVPAEQKPAG